MIRAAVYRFNDYEFEIVVSLTADHFFQRLGRLGFITLATGRMVK